MMPLQTVITLFAAVAIAATPPLQVDDAFPIVTGRTISGVAKEIPDGRTSSARVLVFSFSKSGGFDARLWSERFNKDFDALSGASWSSIIMLESVPKLFRGIALSNIKSSVPTPLWEKTILVFKDEALWKSRLAFSGDTQNRP
jgi:hypothetical protein